MRSLFTVDEQKCISCGLCVRLCPMRIIVLSEETRMPRPGLDAEKLCINCGRCVDKCPTIALYHRYRKFGKKRRSSSVSVG